MAEGQYLSTSEDQRRRRGVEVNNAAGAATANSLRGATTSNCVLEAEKTADDAISKPPEESEDTARNGAPKAGDPTDNVGGTVSHKPPKAGERTDNTARSTSPAVPSQPMDPQLLKAATSGDSRSMHGMASQDPDVLLGRTPAGNTCLHISAAHGYEAFCKDVLVLKQSLVTAINDDDETPLITAVKYGHVSLALALLPFCRREQLGDAILQKDKKGCNTLHYAIHGGHKELALELIAAEPALSRAVNQNNESPMFLAAVTDFTDVLGKLLEISDSANGGPNGQNALHAAVTKGNPEIVRRIMKARPWLAREENGDKVTPMRKALHTGKTDILTVLLEHDRSLGYLRSSRNNAPPLSSAAAGGHVGIARELLKHCPDTPYCDAKGWTCLHTAVQNGRIEFVQFLLGSKQLPPLVNMQNRHGETALHIAAREPNLGIISALLLHQGIDITLLNNRGQTARQALPAAAKDVKDFSQKEKKDVKDSIWIADGAATTGSSGSTGMDMSLLEAATSGNTSSMKQLALQDPGVLLGTTQQGNTCLHIASAYGHEAFCKDLLALKQSLVTAVNNDDETPLITAVKCGHVSLALALLMFCRRQLLSDAVLLKDKKGCNALHYAIRSGRVELALELIATEPALSRAVNNNNESPLFISVMKNFIDVSEKLLQVPNFAHAGASRQNVLHAAVTKGNPDMARRIMEARPGLAKEEIIRDNTPMHQASHEGKINVLKVLLEHDRSLGYLVSRNGVPLLNSAASYGHVDVARELLIHCPDAPYCDKTGWTCLHAAVSKNHANFVAFVLGSQHLRGLVNMQDQRGQTPLHIAAENGGSRMVSLLLHHQGIDVTLLNNSGKTASQLVPSKKKIRIAEATATTGSPGATPLDRRLLQAATTGDATKMMDLAQQYPGVLLGTTQQGNTCLHIASAHSHEGFCKNILELNHSLIKTVNANGETPLLTTVISGQIFLASFFLRYCVDHDLSETIMKQDKHGCNVLHHAIRSGHRILALELIEAEPALSKAVNKNNESPMFIAVVRDSPEIFEKLLEVSDSAHGGTSGFNALHAAVRYGNQEIAKKLVETRPTLAREQNSSKMTPMYFAALENKISMLKVLLQHDFSLGYAVSTDGHTLLGAAAFRGHVGVARELLKHCPDAPYLNGNGTSCLHIAVRYGQEEFVEFVMQSKQLRKLINMRDNKGNTALHYAIRKCNPKIVAALLRHQDRDVRILNHKGKAPVWVPSDGVRHAKTLNWNEVYMLMLRADPKDEGQIYNLYKSIKDGVIEKSRSNIRSLAQTYTSNTSLVAILIATITFAAAFTLPGGYSSNSGSEGLPIMARQLAFQAFLISDTLAMCSSLSVAFICIIGRWEDLEFLLYYRSFTKKLMWFAYMATITAFATGLYTVLAPRLLWLAIAVCIVSFSLFIFTKLFGEWPVLGLKFRMGRTFKSEILDIV